MNKKPQVSVIMPAYNCEKYIRQAIDSVLAQTYPHFELIIADDASKDTTKQIISSYTDSRIRTDHNPENMGYLRASNKLMALAKGDYITFQDADDWSEPDRLERLLKEFSEDSELACVGSFVTKVDAGGKFLHNVAFKCSYEEIVQDLPYKINCVGSALMIRRDVYDTLGLYHVYFDRIGSEDLYWFGTIAKNFMTRNIPYALYNYRSTPGSISTEVVKAPKKIVSHELSIRFLEYYFKTGKSIFNNSKTLKVIENYLVGKALCWGKLYKQGLALIIRSLFMQPTGYPERYSLLKVYLPKLFSANG